MSGSLGSIRRQEFINAIEQSKTLNVDLDIDTEADGKIEIELDKKIEKQLVKHIQNHQTIGFNENASEARLMAVIRNFQKKKKLRSLILDHTDTREDDDAYFDKHIRMGVYPQMGVHIDRSTQRREYVQRHIPHNDHSDDEWQPSIITPRVAPQMFLSDNRTIFH
jgi:hypothetical protein